MRVCRNCGVSIDHKIIGGMMKTATTFDKNDGNIIANIMGETEEETHVLREELKKLWAVCECEDMNDQVYFAVCFATNDRRAPHSVYADAAKALREHYDK